MSTRKAFEKWAKSGAFDVEMATEGFYKNDDISFAWQVWQYATRVEREACLDAADKAYATDNVLEAIRARGGQS